MDFDENEENTDGVTKWPFYLAALFILLMVLYFAYLELQTTNQLDTWQLITCILASGLASILVFIPHLIDRFLVIAFDPSNRKDEELHRKTYFDIKEMRNELESFSVKIDKVPTLVDKIVSENGKSENPNSAIAQISDDLSETKNNLLEKLQSIEELTVQQPLLPEPDPGVAQANQLIKDLQKSIDSLSGKINNLHDLVNELPGKFPEPVVIEKNISLETSSTSETRPEDFEKSEVTPQPESKEDAESAVILEDNPSEIADNTPDEPAEQNEASEIEVEDVQDGDGVEDLNLDDDDSEPTQSPEATEEVSVEVLDEQEDTEASEHESLEDNSLNPDKSSFENDDAQESSEIEPIQEDLEEELALDLPDPAETLRKVDAILQDTDPNLSPESKPEEKEDVPKKSSTGTTSVVANVMIGIGNKPFLRGEGPGLNWDEGVPMNFIEIGKWAWSPPRKNASLTVQVFRNDNDPDQSGKIEVKAGEKIEITPKFG